MNEQLLRQRLAGAVADVEPTSRLDEILATPRRSSGRGPQVLAVAAVVLVLAAIAAIAVLQADRDTAVVSNQPTTTTEAPAGPPTVGEAALVPTDLLPVGFELVAERTANAQISDDTFPYTVLTFASSAASYDEGGPAIRVGVLADAGWGDAMRALYEPLGLPRPERDAIMRREVDWIPNGTDELLPVLDGPWMRYGRITGYDTLLVVDGRDVDDATLEALIRAVRPST